MKFHLMSLGFLQVVLILAIMAMAALFFMPSTFSSGWASFRKVNRGSSVSPFTSIFASWSNWVLYLAVQNSWISPSSPGA